MGLTPSDPLSFREKAGEGLPLPRGAPLKPLPGTPYRTCPCMTESSAAGAALMPEAPN